MFAVRGLTGVIAVAMATSLGGVAVFGTPAASATAPATRGTVSLVDGFDLRLSGTITEGVASQAGYSVASAGDVNGDGFDDVIVGAPAAKTGEPGALARTGAAFVVYGTAAGWSSDSMTLETTTAMDASVGFRIDGAGASDYVGWSVAGAGDVNGDGLDDVIIGAFYTDAQGNSNAGSAFVVYGVQQPASGVDVRSTLSLPAASEAMDPAVGFRIDGAVANDNVGAAVAGAGDVNGDGLDDVILGATGVAAQAISAAGSVFVVYGVQQPASGVDVRSTLSLPPGSSPMDPSVGFRIDGATASDYLGSTVAGAGDVNGDGLDDVILGSADVDPRGTYAAGSAYVVYGVEAPAVGFNVRSTVSLPTGSTAMDPAVGFRIDGAAASDYMATSVAGAGDVNDDGVDDVIVGARGVDPQGLSSAGSAYVVYGVQQPATGVDVRSTVSVPTASVAMDPAVGFRIDGAATSEVLGMSVAGAGDINDDGVDDLIIGAIFTSPQSRVQAGSAYVVYGVRQPATGVDVRSTVSVPAASVAMDPAVGFRIDGAATSDSAGRSVAGRGDFNGDGGADLIVGASSVGIPGAAYVIHGAPNTAPVATADAYSAHDGTELSVAKDDGVLANDTDSRGGALTAVLASGPAHGTMDLLADGSFTYTPTEGYGGSDSFTYVAVDREGLTSGVATVSITVVAFTSPSVSIAGTKQVGAELTASGSTATEGATVSYEWFHGTTSLGTGSRFTPDDDELAGESLTVKATFTKSGYAAKTVTSEVFGPLAERATAPVATADAFSAVESVPLAVAADEGVLANDTDVNGDDLTAVLVTDVSHGTLDLKADGSFTYTAAEAYVGTDSFTYQAVDPGALTSSAATVSLTVSARPAFTTSSVAISGVFKVGEELTAVPSSTPSFDAATFEWFHGSTSVGTGESFSPGDGLDGASLTVRATLSKAGYQSVTVTSAVVGPLATRKAPTVRLSSRTAKVRLGQGAVLSWSSARATSVKATGAWSGSMPLHGSRSVKPARVGLSTYGLSASNANGTVRAQVVVAASLPKTTLRVVGKQVRSGKVRVTVRGLAPREAFTVRVGSGKTARGTASAAGVGRVKVKAPKVRSTRKVAVRVTGSLADRTGFVKVKVKRPSR